MALNQERVKQPEMVFGWNYLRHYFEYDPETGRIHHKEIDEKSLPVSSKFGLQHWNKKAGEFADKASYKMRNTKYARVYHASQLGRGIFVAHRLAWLLFYGDWPEGDIDHLDGDGLNNKIENMRDCKETTHNLRNKAVNKSRKYPRGVRFTLAGPSKTPTFKAYCRSDGGKDVQLYSGRDLFEACCARKSWENEMLKDPSNGYTARHFGRE